MSKEVLNKITWSTLRVNLNNSYALNPTWEKVIKLFKQRIDDFYFTPIEIILKPNLQKGEGFAILTLQCALIEMFAAFKSGQIYNINKPARGGISFEYSGSKSFFVSFLQSEPIFENHFYFYDNNGVRQIDQPYNAGDFYNKVRCGLMHEARTKEDWRITANPQKVTSKNSFIGIDNQGNKIIHRTKLHLKLRDFFENTYLAELRLTNQKGNELRRFLARKLDHLHDLPRDTSFDWWLDP